MFRFTKYQSNILFSESARNPFVIEEIVPIKGDIKVLQNFACNKLSVIIKFCFYVWVEI